MHIDKTEILKITGIYMMVNIGAGFTSGQEVLQFFSVFGWSSFLGGIITFLLMVYAGESLIDAGWCCSDNKKISVFEYIGGKYIGKIYNIIIPFLLYGSYIIMVAGAGAVLEQFFRIPNIIGRFIVCTLSVVSVFFKFESATKYLGHMGKFVAGIIIILSLVMILQGLPNILHVSNLIKQSTVKMGSDTFYGAGLLYSGTIILASSQFLFDTGRTVQQRSSCFYGILWGAFGFVLSILTINFAIILHFDKVAHLPIVTLYFAEQISSFLAIIISLLIFVAMYSASTISLWSTVNIIKKKFDFWHKRYITVVATIGAGGFLLSSFSFGDLVNVIYPINGFVGLVLVVLIAIKNRQMVHQLDNKNNL